MTNCATLVVAGLCHEVNRAYCAVLGDLSQPWWPEAPEWQRASAVAGVEAALSNPDHTPEKSHAGWMAQKVADGWVWGPVKDPERKQHPCMVPYAELPPEQQVKDALFLGVVRAAQMVGIAR